MSYRILATTDLSANSKTGLRFAIQLASQIGAELVFLFIVDKNGSSFWSREKYQHSENEILAEKEALLRKFIGKVYKQVGINPGSGTYLVKQDEPVDKCIVRFAKENNIDLICMSTRGAGLIRRFIGTHTSAVLSSSSVPVVAIPKTYRRKAISKIMYASDLKDIDYELEAIRKILSPLKALIYVYHYTIQPDGEAKKVYVEYMDRHSTPDIRFRFKPQNLENTLVDNIKEDSSKLNASLIVMFNLRSNDWIEQILDTSKSATLTFDSPFPVLVFPKRA